MAPGPFSWDGIQFGSIMTFLPKTLSWESGQTKAAGRMARPARPRRRQRSQFYALAAVLSTASAVSLNDLQPIANGVLPTMCNMAYNAPLTGCTAVDFESGSRCSSACRDGIKMIEDVVDAVCDDVSSTRDTVLDFAKRGVMLLHTCDGDGDDFTLAQTTTSTTSRTTTSVQAPPTSIVVPPTSIAVPPTVVPSVPIIFTPPVLTITSRTIGSFTIIPTPEPPSPPPPPPVSSTEVVPPPQPTATATSSLTIIPPLPPLSSTSSQLFTPSTSDTPTSSQTGTQSLSTLTTSATSSATAAETEASSQDDGQGRGGGSPFDTQISSSPRLCANWPLCLTIGAMLLGAMFR